MTTQETPFEPQPLRRTHDQPPAPGLASATVRLLTAVDAQDGDALEAAWASIHPHDVLDDITDSLLPRFVSVPRSLAREHPELATLRAVARMYTPPFLPAELGGELFASAVALLERGRLPWAELALRYWLILSSYHDEVAATRSQLRSLQRRFPERLEASPAAMSMLAALESFAGSPGHAGELWEHALEHEAAADDADTWWWMHWDQAISWLLGAGGQACAAATTLRRVRDHFADRRGLHAMLAFYGGAANLAQALLLLGRPAEALQELLASARRLPPGSEHEVQLVAQTAVMHAEREDWAAMRTALEGLDRSALDAPATAFMVTGPARLLERAARRDLRGVLATVAELEGREDGAQAMPDHRVAWRLYATRALLALEEPALAGELVVQARTVCAAEPLPIYDAHVCLLELACATADPDRLDETARDTLVERCAATVRDAAARGDLDLVAHGRGELLGGTALWVALAADPDLEPLARRVFAATDPQLVFDALDAATRLVGEGRAARFGAALQRFGLGDGSVLARQPMVRIQVLGGCRVAVDGEEVPLIAWRGRRQARLLMAHLLMADGTALHREQVADLLWPDLPPDRITVRLAPLVHALRAVLAAEQDGGSDQRFLQSANGKLRLQLAPGDSCDLLEVLDAVRVAQRSRDPEEVVRQAIRAVGAYDGPFMAGEGFDEALEAPRALIAELVADAAVRGSEFARSSNDVQLLAAALKRLLLADPVREDVCRALMSLYGRMSDLAAVSRVYHATKTALERELGMVPSRQTRELHASLIRDASDLEDQPDTD